MASANNCPMVDNSRLSFVKGGAMVLGPYSRRASVFFLITTKRYCSRLQPKRIYKH